MTMIGLRFDLRVPPFGSASHAQLYRACLDMAQWADEQRLDFIALSEHHGVEDGFMSAPIAVASAIAGRTRNIGISIAALLVPLHDPVRMAEELAAVSLLSGGRVSVVAGLGYRPEEFAMADVDRKRRGKLLDEYVGVMRQAWTGEPFEWRGRTVRVTPKPDVPPFVLIGGSTENAARRAARLGAGFFPAVGDPKLAELYQLECARLGFAGGIVMMPGGPGFVHVSDDPERDWQRIGPHALWDAQTYDSWQTPDQRGSEVHVHATDMAAVRASGVYEIFTPEQCLALAKKHGRVVLHPLMGGIAPELGWEGLRRFEREVLPRLR
jgi:alkanesulfonate monooxygenase SsuD/methylene tetrahydromethanopterin reductase-like flavin-dependent oxidoreductase (luciferase family)